MKTLRILITVIFATLLGAVTSAQTHDHSQMNMSSSKTESFKVFGKCDMSETTLTYSSLDSMQTN
jgi:hypothetical protein